MGQEAGEAVIVGDGLHARPDEFAEFGGEREVSESFAVEAALAFDDFEAERREDFTGFRFDDLKFLEAAFEAGGRNVDGGPERLERGQVVNGGTANAVERSTHAMRGN